jgi:hypothetical protein
MRRFWSISALVAQVAFLLSPAWSQDMSPLCCQSKAVAMCHRTAGHSHAATHAKSSQHCDEMVSAPAEPALADSVAAGHSHPCPMDCCTQGSPKSVSAVTSTSLIPPLAVTDAEIHFVPVLFVSAVFSSHTDRGPPPA